jgi:hypothetical protein
MHPNRQTEAEGQKQKQNQQPQNSNKIIKEIELKSK